eukprot:5937836-Pyramimonas_sp.AAC.1
MEVHTRYMMHVCQLGCTDAGRRKCKGIEVGKVGPAYGDAADLATTPRHSRRGRSAPSGGRAASSNAAPSGCQGSPAASAELEHGGR